VKSRRQRRSSSCCCCCCCSASSSVASRPIAGWGEGGWGRENLPEFQRLSPPCARVFFFFLKKTPGQLYVLLMYFRLANTVAIFNFLYKLWTILTFSSNIYFLSTNHPRFYLKLNIDSNLVKRPWAFHLYCMDLRLANTRIGSHFQFFTNFKPIRIYSHQIFTFLYTITQDFTSRWTKKIWIWIRIWK
jgi:hypothetical protein